VLDRIPFGPILAILALLCALLFPATAVMGLGASSGWVTIPAHVNWSVPVTLLTIFTHAIIMFYFIGTGSRIKEVVRELGLDSTLYRRTLAFKTRVFPLSSLTLLVVMAAYILGGGTHTHFRWTPPLLHGIVGGVAVLLNLLLCLREVGCISDNLTLVDEVDQAVLSATR